MTFLLIHIFYHIHPRYKFSYSPTNLLPNSPSPSSNPTISKFFSMRTVEAGEVE